MPLFIDQKYLSIVSVKLEGFVRKGNNIWNMRCPKCGDSRKSKSKKRGYIYQYKGNLLFRCHNCSASMSFGNFLKMVDPFVYQEYQMECYQSNKGGNTPKPDWTKLISKPTFPQSALAKINLPALSSLPDNHTARKYAASRKIPAAWLDRIYYANDFKAFIDEEFPGNDKQLKADDARIVLPFFDREKCLLGVQGRALSNTAKPKYLTILGAGNVKVFGLDRLDFTQPILVVEGPIDSMFLPNSIATMDASLRSVIGTIGDYDYTFKQMKRSIDTGKRVCIWPKENQYKDINDMVMGGMTPATILSVIEQHTHQGLKAQLEFNLWRRA
jgi:hypothetical protein